MSISLNNSLHKNFSRSLLVDRQLITAEHVLLYRHYPPRPQCYKTFYVRNLRNFVISYSVCTWQAFPAYSNRHSSLVQKLVNYGQKKFYNIDPYGEPIATVGYIFIGLDPNSIKL